MKYQIKNLLSKGTTNAKTIKNDLETYILYLSPYNQNKFKINVCPNATNECIKLCLFTSGMGIFSNVKNSRINKTNYFLEEKENFINQLVKELEKINKKAIKENKQIAIRLNGTSDLDFFPIIYNITKNKVFDFSNLVFYDYTKILGKIDKYSKNLAIGEKYTLTYSYSENSNFEILEKVLNNGHNVSMVFNDLEKVLNGKDKIDLVINSKKFTLVNGDKSDLEMIYNKGKILGLQAKGKARGKENNFVYSLEKLINSKTL